MRSLSFASFGLVVVLSVVLASPVAADLSQRNVTQYGADPGYSAPVPLSQFDRLMAPASGSHLVTVYVSMNSNWLNQTERNMIMETVQSKYSFASTLISFTTVKPTTGSYHQITVWPGRDTDPGDGVDWGEASSTQATVFAGEFTQDPAVNTIITNSTQRANAIGECIAHELDHILRGSGHVNDPNDVNAHGTRVSYTGRGTGGRTFSDKDKNTKITNITMGKTYNAYNAKDDKFHNNISFVFGGEPETWFGKPDNHWVSFEIALYAPAEEFQIGILSDDGFWSISPGMDPPGVFDTSIPPGVRIDFALTHLPSGEYWPLSTNGEVMEEPASMIDPFFSIDPMVPDFYFGQAMLHWDTPFGPVDAFLNVTSPDGLQGFQIHNDPVGIRHGLLPPQPRLLQNYPNPFRNDTNIAFYVPGAESASDRVPVRLEIFDIQGRLIRTLVDEPMEPGMHTVPLERSALGNVASGVFFYRINVGGEKVTRKLVLLH